MIHLFIDTNIFLSFYHYSNDDLDKLNDLNTLINETSDIKLWVSSHLVDEFNRNREGKIKDALKRFNQNELNTGAPKLCMGYEEIKNYKRLLGEANVVKGKLLKKLSFDIENKSLKADKLIQTLFLRPVLKIDDDTINDAKKRFDIGNPPGKKRYGDAINWEFLLKNVPIGEDLYLVSIDSDYDSPLYENKISDFLKDEWEKRKQSKINYYKSLNWFFKDKFPNIKLDDEFVKEARIERFTKSTSFNEARKNLRDLLTINDFTTPQLNQIVRASITNDQIYNAHKYSPEIVGGYLEQIIRGHEEQIDYANYLDFCSKFDIIARINLTEENEDEDDDDEGNEDDYYEDYKEYL